MYNDLRWYPFEVRPKPAFGLKAIAKFGPTHEIHNSRRNSAGNIGATARAKHEHYGSSERT